MKVMTYIDPIAKHYYTLFTQGKKAEILGNIEEFYGIYRHIMDDMVPVTNEHGGIVTATLVSAVVDDTGTGYGVLNVLGYVDDSNVPFDCLTDIAWIEKGVLHTWFPYPKVAFYTKDGVVKVAKLSDMKNYETKERAMRYIRQTSMEEKLHDSISKGIMNGVYKNNDLTEALLSIPSISSKVEEESKAKEDDKMSLADMMDDWGMTPKEPLEELEEYNQSRKELLDSEMAMLFVPEEEGTEEIIDDVVVITPKEIEEKEPTTVATETKELELEDIIEADFVERATDL